MILSQYSTHIQLHPLGEPAIWSIFVRQIVFYILPSFVIFVIVCIFRAFVSY